MYAFVHIHKAAGTTLKSILRRSFGLRHFEDRLLGEPRCMMAGDLRRVRWVYPRVKSIAGHYVRPFSNLHEAAADIRYYTFLREPFGRTLSMFSARMADGHGKSGFPDSEAELRQSFQQMVQQHGNWQTRHLAAVADATEAIRLLQERLSFVGLVERFDESLVMLRRWMGDVDLDIGYRPLNVSDERLQRDRWAAATPERLRRIRDFVRRVPADAELTDLVRAANQQDLLLYQYVREVTYPAQCRRYGDSLAGDVQQFQTWLAAAAIRFSDSVAGRIYRNLFVKRIGPWLFRKAA